MKKGLDYFSFSCQTEQNIELVEAECGLKAFAIIVKLYQKIFGEDGYFCEWDDDISLLFASKKLSSSGDINLLKQVIGAALRRGVFSKEMYEKYSILTSEEIQKMYFEACKRRERVEVKIDYLLINVTQNNVFVDGIPINVYRNSVNDDGNAQSKVKESKGKEIILNNNMESDASNFTPPVPDINSQEKPFVTLPLKDGTEYPLYDGQIDYYKMLHPAVDVKQQLLKMRGWIDSKPENLITSEGITHFITKWLSSAPDQKLEKKGSNNKFINFDQKPVSPDLEKQILQAQDRESLNRISGTE